MAVQTKLVRSSNLSHKVVAKLLWVTKRAGSNIKICITSLYKILDLQFKYKVNSFDVHYMTNNSLEQNIYDTYQLMQIK